MKNIKKVSSKTVAPLYFADTYAHRHTWIPHKARFRFSNDGYGAPYPDTPSRGVTRDRIKRGFAKLLEKFIKDNTYGEAIRGHRIKRGFAL